MMIALLLLSPGDAWAIGNVMYRSPVDRALASRGALTWWLLGSASTPGAVFAAGQRRLFGITGFNSDQVRAGLRGHNAGVLVSVAQLTYGAGRERAGTVEFFTSSYGVFVSASLAYADAVFAGFHASRLVTLSGSVGIDIGNNVAVAYGFMGARIAGESGVAPTSVVHAVVGRGYRVSAGLSIAIDQHGRSAFNVAASLRASLLRVVAGYRDDSAQMQGAVQVDVRQMHVSAGASLHPQLGVTKEVFVRWGW